MTQTQLPRRPWVPLPPPDGGLEDVRRDARGRRRRRAIAVAALGSGVATTATVLALLGGSGDLAVLKTNVPPAVQPSPAVSRITGVATPPAQIQQQRAQAAASSAHAQAVIAQQNAATSAQSSGDSHGSTSSSTSPQMSRYKSTASMPAVCESASGDNNSNSVYTTVDWCLNAVTAASADGRRLTVSLCRSGSSSGTLDFATTNEADITVQRNGKTVWDWARSHPARSSSHTLTLAPNDCWNWSLVWPDITQSGSSAGSGSYTFVATTYARELAHNETASVTFTV